MMEVVQNLDGTWRVKDVPLIGTGIEYPLLSGPTTFTEDQLADAVAALEDPAIVEPRIKLGHTAGYNEALVGDAEQAFGRIDGSTMRLGDNNQTIYGDYTGLPEWLAKVMGMAYPSRSVEGNFDVTTATGKEYQLVITAVSLLGIYWPGCQVLEDLPLWYGSGIPSEIEFSDSLQAQLLAAGGGGMDEPGILADADTSRIRRQFYDRAMGGELELPEGIDSNTYWWWIRGERIADNGGVYLIVEDEDAGDLFRFDVTVSGDEVNFGEAMPVTVEYPQKTAAAHAAVVAGMKVLDPKIVLHASRTDTGGPAIANKEGVSKMDDATRKRLAASLSLPEDATEEQIKAKAGELKAAAEEAENTLNEPNPGLPANQVTPEIEGDTHQTPPGTHPTGAGADDVNAPADDLTAGTVQVDKVEWERTKDDAALARKHEEDRVKDARASIVTDAIKAGKFAPARRAHYEKLLASDFEGGKATIESLEAGLVPVNERGTAGGGGDEGVAATTSEGLPDAWFPDIHAKRVAAGTTPVVTQAKEG